MTIRQVCTIQLPEIIDPRGNLCFVENKKHIPFDIKRVYYLYGVPEKAERGGHAHKELHQVIISLAGHFEIILDNGQEKKSVCLHSPTEGLYIPPYTWRELINFSSNAVCLVLASEFYYEEDYFRDYKQFLDAVRVKKEQNEIVHSLS